jgi:hypothetical protein
MAAVRPGLKREAVCVRDVEKSDTPGRQEYVNTAMAGCAAFVRVREASPAPRVAD